MKIENYIDCVNFYKGSNISKIKWMREDIIGHLPSKRILEASSILVVRMANDEMYLVKNRGNNDKNIEDIDFNVVSLSDFSGCKDHLEKAQRTMKFIRQNNCILYDMREWVFDEEDKIVKH